MRDISPTKAEASTTARLIRLAKRTFTPAAFSAILFVAWQSREHLAESARSAELSFILFSVAAWILLHGIAPAFSSAGLAAFGHRLSFADAFFIHNRRLPAKYLPGGIWHTVAKGVDYKAQGASHFQITCYLITESALLVVGASMLGSIALLVSQANPALNIAFITIISAGFLFLTTAPAILKIYSKDAKRLFSAKHYINSVSLTFAHWGLAAVSFTLYLQAFPEIKAALPLIQIAGTYLVSWAAGYIAIFAPQGIGVSEVVSAALLKDAGSLGSLVALITTFRIVVLVGDIGAWALATIAFHATKQGQR